MDAANGIGWWLTKDGDEYCLEMYLRHYSANRYADGRRENGNGSSRYQFVGPGEKWVLRTWDCSAMWVWRKFIDDCIDQRTGQRQQGINCAVFRNESPQRSSTLVRAADAIADCIWPGERHYTYVDAKKIRSKNPGYCFLKAGWQRAGHTKNGLIVLEKLPTNGETHARDYDTQGQRAE